MSDEMPMHYLSDYEASLLLVDVARQLHEQFGVAGCAEKSRVVAACERISQLVATIRHLQGIKS